MFETIQSFSGADADHVHEAPVYLPSTNELVFADTSVIGWLWATNIDTHEVNNLWSAFDRASNKPFIL